MDIHHIVLKRIDGSELRRKFVAVSITVPRVGSAIQLAIGGLGAPRVTARITAVEILSAVPAGGGSTRATELTVYAQELLHVPIADNDP